MNMPVRDMATPGAVSGLAGDVVQKRQGTTMACLCWWWLWMICFLAGFEWRGHTARGRRRRGCVGVGVGVGGSVSAAGAELCLRMTQRGIPSSPGI
jgi:hypothetical protein